PDLVRDLRGHVSGRLPALGDEPPAPDAARLRAAREPAAEPGEHTVEAGVDAVRAPQAHARGHREPHAHHAVRALVEPRRVRGGDPRPPPGRPPAVRAALTPLATARSPLEPAAPQPFPSRPPARRPPPSAFAPCFP